MLVKPDVNGQMENWDKYPDNLRSQTSIDTNIGQRKVKEGLGKEGLRLVMFWEMGPARLKPRTSMQNCAQPPRTWHPYLLGLWKPTFVGVCNVVL